jgi:hypothetical protein
VTVFLLELTTSEQNAVALFLALTGVLTAFGYFLYKATHLVDSMAPTWAGWARGMVNFVFDLRILIRRRQEELQRYESRGTGPLGGGAGLHDAPAARRHRPSRRTKPPAAA